MHSSQYYSVDLFDGGATGRLFVSMLTVVECLFLWECLCQNAQSREVKLAIFNIFVQYSVFSYGTLGEATVIFYIYCQNTILCMTSLLMHDDLCSAVRD